MLADDLTDIDEPLGTTQRVGDLVGLRPRIPEDADRLIADELHHHAAGIEHGLARLRVIRGHRLSHDRLVASVADIAGKAGKVGHHDDQVSVDAGIQDLVRLKPEFPVNPLQLPRAEMPQQGVRQHQRGLRLVAERVAPLGADDRIADVLEIRLVQRRHA